MAIICIALLLFGGLAITHSTLSSVDMVSTSWKEMETNSGEIARTEIEATTADLDATRTIVRVTVVNQGQVSLHDFSKWDVIVQYYDEVDVYHIVRVDYTSSATPADNQWTVEGIYLDASAGTPEAFEPNILNPGEEMIAKIKLSPAIKGVTNFLVAVATPNGVATSKTFTA